MTGLLFALLAIPALAWAWFFRDLLRGVDTRRALPRRRTRREREAARIFVRFGATLADWSSAMYRVSAAFAAATPSMRQALKAIAEVEKAAAIEAALLLDKERRP